MEQKIELICEWQSGKYTITELCNGFDISHPTAYRLIDRYEKLGLEGLKYQPNRTLESVEKKILPLKEKYPRWGSQETPSIVV